LKDHITSVDFKVTEAIGLRSPMKKTGAFAFEKAHVS